MDDWAFNTEHHFNTAFYDESSQGHSWQSNVSHQSDGFYGWQPMHSQYWQHPQNLQQLPHLQHQQGQQLPGNKVSKPVRRNQPIPASQQGSHGNHSQSTAPSQNSNLPSTGHRNKMVVEGPQFLKLIVSETIAGAIVGKDGTKLGELEMRSRCRLQLSAPGNYFPGTKDRICVLGGKLPDLENCLVLIVKLVCDLPGTNTTRMLKLAVPNSAVSMVIGHGGELIRRLCNETGCRINASIRMHSMQERLIILAGAHNALVRASLELLRIIQEDPHLQEHMHFSYENIELPLGAWAGPEAQISTRRFH